MKRLLILIFLMSTFSIFAQKSVYVSASKLNLRSQPNTTSSIQQTLNQYDNLIVLDTVNVDWLKVSYGLQSGYVSLSYVKKGKAKVYTVTGGRIGAICMDGTRSSATGRGACSHHGGVSRWLYSESQNVEILDE